VPPNSPVSVITTARRWMAACALLVPWQPGGCFSSRTGPGPPADAAGRRLSDRPVPADGRAVHVVV